MGVIYKIKPEVRDFILKHAQQNPLLGCRKLSEVIESQLKVRLSKSAISDLLKEEKLNKPVGRRRIHTMRSRIADEMRRIQPQTLNALLYPSGVLPEESSSLPVDVPAVAREAVPPVETKPAIPLVEIPPPPPLEKETVKEYVPRQPARLFSELTDPLLTVSDGVIPDGENKYAGMWFLKAADLAMGGCQAIASVLQGVLPSYAPADVLGLCEALLYLLFLNEEQDFSLKSEDQRQQVSLLVGRSYSPQEVNSFLADLAARCQDFSSIIAACSGVLGKISGVGFAIDAKKIFFIDAGTHSVWGSCRIPTSLAMPTARVRQWLSDSFGSPHKPLVLQSYPGSKSLSEAFYNFVAASLPESAARIRFSELYGVDNALMETFEIPGGQRPMFIVALWPWQYQNIKRIDLGGEPKSYSSAFLEETFLCKESEVKIGDLAVRGIVVRQGDKEIMTLLTNIDASSDSATILSGYLERWPHLDSGYQDFLNKLEFDTLLSPEVLPPVVEISPGDVKAIFLNWLHHLHNYCKNQFFPHVYKELPTSMIKERFYTILGRQFIQNGHFVVKFNVHSNATYYYDDFIYACQRVNEQSISLPNTQRLFFSK